MSTMVGSNYIYLICDWEKGCTSKTGEYHTVNQTYSEINELVRTQEKWYVSFTDDRAYCPEHSPYNTNQGA